MHNLTTAFFINFFAIRVKPSRCYAIPTRRAIHGPVGGIPHVPQPGSRGFSAGRGNAGHLPHQQQQPIGAGMGSSFNFPSMETPNSQPFPGGPLSQPGFVSNMTQGASQTYRDGFSVGGMSQDFLGDDFKSQGSHVQYNVGDLSTQTAYKQLSMISREDQHVVVEACSALTSLALDVSVQVVGKLGFVSDMVAQTIMLSKDVMKSFKLLCAHKDPEVQRLALIVVGNLAFCLENRRMLVSSESWKRR
ncbi:RNA helicase [Artemisia annua]|uniref:RNA helicase n=1 Tax=Artemisia annua TaxID=35608 RepID=A0A2U1MHM9_ARTAN|nr:RNA helicase [Artemisia annua]